GGDCWLNAGSKAERLTVRSPALPAFTDDASKVRGPRQPTLRGNINGTPHIPSAPLGRTGRHAATALLRASAHPTSACKALPWGLRHRTSAEAGPACIPPDARAPVRVSGFPLVCGRRRMGPPAHVFPPFFFDEPWIVHIATHAAASSGLESPPH